MKKSQKLLSVLLALVMVFALMGTALADNAAPVTIAAPAGKDIVVLYTNDVHGAAADKTLGYDGLAAYKKDMLKTTDYVSLVDAGDFVQGGTINTLSQGQETVTIMNKVGYDVVTVGNHEFDWKIPQLLKLMGGLTAKVVSCNFMDLKTGKPVFDAYTMLTYGSVKIAYVGITTPESYTKSTPGYVEDAQGNAIYGLCEGSTAADGTNLYKQVQATVDAAKAAGANYVVALGHLGIEGTTEGLKSTDVIANTTGIDVMLDGHSHETIPSMTAQNKDGKNVLLSSTGTGLAAIGKLVIKSDGAMTTELVTDYTAKDADTTALIKSINDKYAGITGAAVGESKVTLPISVNGKRIVRNADSALGDFDTDALRSVMGTDVAFTNGGGLREAIKAGPLTFGDVLKLHPFGNTIVSARVTGQQLLDALEMGARLYPQESGGFLHASGLKYTIDSTVPSSVQTDAKGVFTGVSGAYRVKDVQVLDKAANTYKALDLAKTYTLAMNSYNLMYRGDGFSMFKGAAILQDTGVLDCEVVQQYIAGALKGVIPDTYAAPQGRISIIRAVSDVYTDVAAGDWFTSFVQYCYNNKLISGTSDTTFDPALDMDRATFVTMLYALAGRPDVTAGSTFTDVSADAWYAKAVTWAVSNGITAGRTTTTFAPGDTMSREEMAVFIYKYCSAPAAAGTLTYTDASAVSDWAVSAVSYCTAKNYMTGSNGAFDPAGGATRAMGAVVLTALDKAAK